MSRLSDAADAALQWAEKNRAVVELADVLKDIGSIEQATDEAKVALALAAADRDVMRAELDSVKQALEKSKALVASTTSDAEKTVQALLDDGRRAAQGIVERGQTEAASMLADAQTKINNATAVHAANMTAAREQLAQLKQAVSECQDTLAGLRAELADARTNLQAVRDAARSIFTN